MDVSVQAIAVVLSAEMGMGILIIIVLIIFRKNFVDYLDLRGMALVGIAF